MKIYLLISVIMTIFTLVYIKLNPSSGDTFELLNKLSESLNQLRDEGCVKFADFMESIINSAINGNMFPFIMLVFTLYLIPILRWIVFIGMFKKKNKQN